MLSAGKRNSKNQSGVVKHGQVGRKWTHLRQFDFHYFIIYSFI